jgi:hypothetical protein
MNILPQYPAIERPFQGRPLQTEYKLLYRCMEHYWMSDRGDTSLAIVAQYNYIWYSKRMPPHFNVVRPQREKNLGSQLLS